MLFQRIKNKRCHCAVTFHRQLEMGSKQGKEAQKNEFAQLEKQFGNIKKLTQEKAQALVKTSHKIFEALDTDHSNYLEGAEREELFSKIYEYAAPIFKKKEEMEYFGDSAFVKVINELFKKNPEGFVGKSIAYFDDNNDGKISLEEVYYFEFFYIELV